MIEKAAAKLIAYALLALLVVGLFTAWRVAADRAEAAETRAETLGAALAAHIANAEAVGAIMAEAAEKDRRRGVRLAELEEAVRNAKTPVPAACRPVLAPLGRALDGVRSLRSERDGASTPGPLLRGGPVATGVG